MWNRHPFGYVPTTRSSSVSNIRAHDLYLFHTYVEFRTVSVVSPHVVPLHHQSRRDTHTIGVKKSFGTERPNDLIDDVQVSISFYVLYNGNTDFNVSVDSVDVHHVVGIWRYIVVVQSFVFIVQVTDEPF